MFLGEDLRIRSRLKGRIFLLTVFLGKDTIAEVQNPGTRVFLIVFCESKRYGQVEQTDQRLEDGQVEIEEEFIRLFVERLDFFGVENKIGRTAIRGLDAVPVLLLPGLVVGNTDFPNRQALIFSSLQWDGKSLYLIGASDMAPVAITSFLIVFVLFDPHLLIRQQLGAVLDGRQVLEFE